MKKQIVKKMPARALAADPRQERLDLMVVRQQEFDGIGMGVLQNGVPFLNQRGLARLCGVRNKYIGLISSDWNSENPSVRTSAIKALLKDQGEDNSIAVYEAAFGNVRVLAYPDIVCMAILEYFAFEENLSGQPIALGNYRNLARHGLRSYIFEKVGYTPSEHAGVWQVFKDRVGLTYDAVPEGYFGIFKELSGLIVTLGLSGMHIDENFVPDISVGQAWSTHWNKAGLEKKFGRRASYLHNYPPYFPQSASNPQLAACYPEDALADFRRWFRNEYIGEGRFKRYLTRKVNEMLLPVGYVERAMLALTKDGKA